MNLYEVYYIDRVSDNTYQTLVEANSELDAIKKAKEKIGRDWYKFAFVILAE